MAKRKSHDDDPWDSLEAELFGGERPANHESGDDENDGPADEAVETVAEVADAADVEREAVSQAEDEPEIGFPDEPETAEAEPDVAPAATNAAPADDSFWDALADWNVDEPGAAPAGRTDPERESRPRGRSSDRPRRGGDRDRDRGPRGDRGDRGSRERSGDRGPRRERAAEGERASGEPGSRGESGRGGGYGRTDRPADPPRRSGARSERAEGDPWGADDDEDTLPFGAEVDEPSALTEPGEDVAGGPAGDDDSESPNRRRRRRRRGPSKPLSSEAAGAVGRDDLDDEDDDEPPAGFPEADEPERTAPRALDDEPAVERESPGRGRRPRTGRGSSGRSHRSEFIDDEGDDEDAVFVHDAQPAEEAHDEDDDEHVEAAGNWGPVPTWEEAISYLLHPETVQLDPHQEKGTAAKGNTAAPQASSGPENRSTSRHYGRRRS